MLALGAARDNFAEAVRGYFAVWTEALAQAFASAGHERAQATELAEELWPVLRARWCWRAPPIDAKMLAAR